MAKENSEPEKAVMNMTSMAVDPRTEEYFDDMGKESRTSKAVRFQQMAIFCYDNNFQVETAVKEWEDVG